MAPTVKDVNSQLQSALGAILELQQEVSLLKTSNKTLTDSMNNLLKLIGNSGVESDWGWGSTITTVLYEMGNHVQSMEEELGFDNNGESTLVNSLKEKLNEKRSPCPHPCAQSEAKDHTPAAQIWGPSDTSFLDPLRGSILELKKDFSTISKRIQLTQSSDPNSNLVLYGIPEN